MVGKLKGHSRVLDCGIISREINICEIPILSDKTLGVLHDFDSTKASPDCDGWNRPKAEGGVTAIRSGIPTGVKTEVYQLLAQEPETLF